MNIELNLIRIAKARRAASAARNPLFKQYWTEVADTLQAKVAKALN